MKSPTWYRVLEAARGLGDVFTGPELARAAKIPLSHGTAWAGKLTGWGYLRRGPRPNPGTRRAGRPVVTFKVTGAGRSRQAPKTVRGTRTSKAER